MEMKRDGLKPLAELLEPDTRNRSFARLNPETYELEPITLEEHYGAIEQYHLHTGVPDKIATQYDVARNIYLYAWFEYRFYNISEAQVLTVLELAMRERIGDEALKAYTRQREQKHKERTGKRLRLGKGMKTLMEYCRDHQLVSNEGFSQWRKRATQRAYFQVNDEQMYWARAEMKRTGATSMELPAIEQEDLTPDPSYDHVQHLINHTNKTRNDYAHGSTMLHNQVLGQFEMVSEFINQLYPAGSQANNVAS